MGWRVAASLDVLLAEVNAHAPNRDKASDGSIGDADHATRDSDHNPWVIDAAGVGVVRARDIDHDPAAGCDAGWIAARVAAQLGDHPALGPGAYVIYDRRIVSTNRLAEGWRYYGGVNAHKAHVHVSVGYAGYDDTTPWNIYDTQEDEMADYARQLDRIEDNQRRILQRLSRDAVIRTKLTRLVRQGKATRNQLEDVLDELDREGES